MSRFCCLLRALCLVSLLLTVGCHKIFGDFTIDDSAFPEDDVQIGPIRLAPTKGLFTTELGGRATFTMVLDFAPTADVTIALSSNNTSEGTVSPTSVTFTKDDWKAPQVITVTGVNDLRRDGNQTYKIITEPAVSEAQPFDGKNPIDIQLINIDDETAGITVVPTAGLVTNESGGQDTFTVVLNSYPQKNVKINLASDTVTEGTVGPEELVFTPVNWMAPQLVTVTGVDDGIVKDGAKAYKVAVSCSSEDQNYAQVAPVIVELVNQDNDSAGITVDLVSGIDPNDRTKLRTSESGDSATFTVALNAPPVGDVLIPVTVLVLPDMPAEAQVSPVLLTFTKENWKAPQTVTVMGLDEGAIADGDQPYTIELGVPSGDDEDYNALAATNVLASNVDNDKAGFTVKLLSGIDPQDPTKLLTSEMGTSATFSLALNSQPRETVTIQVDSSLSTEGVASPKFLTFTTDNWMAPQIVSVKGVDDNGTQDGNPLYYVQLSVVPPTDGPSYALDPADVPVTNQDDDSAGVLIVLVKGIDPGNANRLVTDESGSTATFTVALTSRPADEVVIPLQSSNEKEGTLWTSSLTFTSENYAAAQTVTIAGAGIDDKIADGNQPYYITVGPAVSSNDSNFNGKFGAQVQVVNRDDDTPGVIVTPTSGLFTSEGGKTASFTLRLQSQPTAPVTIDIRSDHEAEAKPNVNSVTFTETNWNANQTITVTGQEDDGVADGNVPYKIILDPARSKDENYNGKPDPADVSLTNNDNDSAGFNVTPTSGLITTEAGGTATFTVSLQSKPVNSSAPDGPVNVKFVLTSSRPTEGSVSPASLTFTPANWKSPQTVTVTGLNDFVADGPQMYFVNLSLASSTDGNYNNHKPSDVSVTNNDNDTAGVEILPTPTQTPAITSEKLDESKFTVALYSQPSGDVTFTVTSLDTGEGRVSPGTLKFTSVNWKTPQVVTVTGVNDDGADGDQQYTVRLSNATSTADQGYNGKFGVDLPFSNIDDDRPGLDIVAAPSLTTTELNMGTAKFTVALKSQPIANVSIGVSSSDQKEGTVAPATLLFTSTNWSTPQTVTITGVQDDVADGPQTYQVKIANASSPGAMGDPNYNGKFATQLDVQNIDEDQPGYAVSAGPMLQTTEGGGKATFSVQLRSKPAGASSVTLGLSSNNTNEGTVSPSSLVFTGSDWNVPHAVTVTGMDDKKYDHNVVYQVGFMADVSYAAPAPSAVTLTNLDDDTLGVLVTPTSCSTTPGTTATFTIRLNSQPSADVTIALTSDKPTAGTVSPESVTFSSALGSWDVTQTVTVTGVNDGTLGMMTPYQIVTGIASAPGETTGYDGYMSVDDDVSCVNTTPNP